MLSIGLGVALDIPHHKIILIEGKGQDTKVNP